MMAAMDKVGFLARSPISGPAEVLDSFLLQENVASSDIKYIIMEVIFLTS